MLFVGLKSNLKILLGELGATTGETSIFWKEANEALATSIGLSIAINSVDQVLEARQPAAIYATKEEA